MAVRLERDSIGELEIPSDALYGIHAWRARDNFPDCMPFPLEWYLAVGTVKLAVYNTYERFKRAALQRHSEGECPIRFLSDDIVRALQQAASEVADGEHFKHFIVPAVSGGAGTSINMNVNEIIANVALGKLGRVPGDYSLVDPIEHANIYQSTNDVIPTSLRVAVMRMLDGLEETINRLRSEVEKYERCHRNDLRIGYTQMQEAVPGSFGRLFSTYNEALSRDWWRVSKCFERVKVVNLGGSATGTGMTVPRYVIMEVVQELQKLTRLPVTRSENMCDATCNLDGLVEVHAILKAHAVNLEKMVSDLRLLASDLYGHGLTLPQKQVGSSIMPGKVNPVIPEFVISAAHKVYANDQLIAGLAAQGCLDLNAYLPIIGHALIESLRLLIGANETVRNNIFDALEVKSDAAYDCLLRSPAISTVLIPYVGYNAAAEISKLMKGEGVDIVEANRRLKLIDGGELNELVKPENLLKEGFSLKDIME